MPCYVKQKSSAMISIPGISFPLVITKTRGVVNEQYSYQNRLRAYPQISRFPIDDFS